MKRGILIASWFVALILGWALRGLNLPSDSQSSSKTTSIQPTKSSQKISRASGRPSYSYPETGRPDSLGSVQIVKEALASGKLDPEELITLTTQILEISDPIERREGVYEITRSLSSGDQVLAVAKAFTELTRTTGRVHNREWSDFLFSSGRLLGADAINKLTAFENRPGFRTKVRDDFCLSYYDERTTRTELSTERDGSGFTLENLSFVDFSTSLRTNEIISTSRLVAAPGQPPVESLNVCIRFLEIRKGIF